MPSENEETGRVTVAAWGRRHGIAKQSAHEAVKKCEIPLVDGKVDPDEATRLYRERMRIRKNPGGAEADPPADPEKGDYYAARTQREWAEARIAELKLAEMEGALTSAEDVSRAVWTAFRMLRDSLMPLGRRVAGKVAGMTDTAAIRDLIDAEQRAALDTFRGRVLAQLVEKHGQGEVVDAG